ncbi:MAG: hypothetical protein AVDCRST_MAG93-9544 [uncultured Chloroflexia bacterium]|uniref:Uncharacterized protein n=1 Tax=uncultured Chloroflexia bacterium TaxID=1672391 RepID=A0A6J4NHM7_9CHLR|nr:MAG: hypothetical protein AVDCRST_MAG93-9544 [uncultured Chloroflexia bacterium]
MTTEFKLTVLAKNLQPSATCRRSPVESAGCDASCTQRNHSIVSSLKAWIGGATVVLASLPLPAFAAPASNGTEVGAWFMGTWAVACDRNIEDDNPLAIFFRAPDTRELLMVVVSRQGGSLTSSVTRVLTKGSARGGQLEVDFDHAQGGINHAVLEITRDAFHVVRTTRSDGLITTREGVVLATGLPTFRYLRCSRTR